MSIRSTELESIYENWNFRGGETSVVSEVFETPAGYLVTVYARTEVDGGDIIKGQSYDFIVSLEDAKAFADGAVKGEVGPFSFKDRGQS